MQPLIGSTNREFSLNSALWVKLVNVVSGVPQGSVLGPLLYLLTTSELLSILENKLIGYADDSTFMAVVPFPSVGLIAAESLIRDIGRVCEWCYLWLMKLNAGQTKTMIVSRSRTIDPQAPPLTIGRTVLKESHDVVILGVTFDSKKTFEKSSPGFRSSFSKILYLEEVLACVK